MGSAPFAAGHEMNWDAEGREVSKKNVTTDRRPGFHTQPKVSPLVVTDLAGSRFWSGKRIEMAVIALS